MGVDHYSADAEQRRLSERDVGQPGETDREESCFAQRAFDMRLVGLTAAHVALLLLVFFMGPLSYNGLLLFIGPIYVGLSAGQVSLAAVWAALGTEAWLWRTMGLVLACAAEGVMLAEGTDRSILDGLVVISSAGLLNAIALGFIRRRTGPLRCESSDSKRPEPAAVAPNPFQFSLSQMMAFTFMVAVIATLLAGVSILDRDLREFATWIILGACFAGVGFTSAWAQLQQRRTWLRSALAVVLSVGFGAAAAVVVNQGAGPVDERALWTVGATVSQSVVMLATLAAVRNWGYYVA